MRIELTVQFSLERWKEIEKESRELGVAPEEWVQTVVRDHLLGMREFKRRELDDSIKSFRNTPEGNEITKCDRHS